MKKKILSVGAGVNSTALLVLAKEGKIKIDLAVFADTGAEYPETYEYIKKIIKPFCRENNIEFVIVGSPTLYQDYFKKKIIPFRRFRSCTDRYKIRPIYKYLNERYGKKEWNIIIGIDARESHRARCGEKYPLIELGIDREGCKNIIRKEGLTIPIKSGCYFCPFMIPNKYKELYNNHKDLFLKAEKFEKNCSQYPKATITRMSLEKIRKAIEEQRPLFIKKEKTDLRCVYCHD